MSRGQIWLIATVLLRIASGVPARGESPFAAELAGFFFRYHEDPPHPDLSNLLALAQVCFLWGKIWATTVPG